MKDKVCLLITVFNRTPQLINSLKRLTRLTLPDEILIVDDGSKSGLEQELKQFEGVLPIRYIYNNNKDWSICSMARNIGIKNTDCEIIITSEPEILFIANNIKEMLSLHYETNKVVSIGTIYHQGEKGVIANEIIETGEIPEKLISKQQSNTNVHSFKGYVEIQGWVAPYSALYRKEWLMEINGWDEQFVKWGFDDTDLLTRLRIKGHNQVIANELKAIHQWHPKLPPDVQTKACLFNEKRMLEKNLNDNDINNPYLIANRDIEWGVIIN